MQVTPRLAREAPLVAAGLGRHELDGVSFVTCAWERLLEISAQCIERRRRLLVLSGNVQAFLLARDERCVRDLLERADVVRVDGEGIRLGAWLLGDRLPPRRTWADFAWDLAAAAEASGHRVFLLGARDGAAARAGGVLRSRFPGLDIVGVHHGYFDKEPGSIENDRVLRQIEEARPDLLIVGFGMPIQERWIEQNFDRIDATVIYTAGAVFDYLSGGLRRPPLWMGRWGLEWLGRFFMEPRRLWRRYLLGNPLFVSRILRQRWRRRRLGEPRRE